MPECRGIDDGLTTESNNKLAPFNPSSEQIQQLAVNLFALGPDDVLCDIGCGDGRMLCFAAAKTPGLRCVGIELDPRYAARGYERIQRQQLAARVTIRIEDGTKQLVAVDDDDAAEDTKIKINNKNNSKNNDNNSNINSNRKEETHGQKPLTELTLYEDATAIYLFVLPKGIVKLMNLLQQVVDKRIRDGRTLKVISYMFRIHAWEPTMVDKTAKAGFSVYYYEFGRTVLD